MADGCLGLQFYIDTGRMIVSFRFNVYSGTMREAIVFPKLKPQATKGLRDPANAKYHLVPNFCPACGEPFITEGDHIGEPSCTGRKKEG